MQFLNIISLFLIINLTSCNVKKAESTLLSDRKDCTNTDCPTPQTTIEGSLSIIPDNGAYQLNVDKSDIIEISGKCTDLGLRKNKIYVEAYEGEDTSIVPYVDNALSINCNGNSTIPSINGQRCFWVTDGKSVLDLTATPALEFPQCYNGKFSFSVRLGKILRTNPTGQSDDTNNPRLKYLIRFKLRTQEGAISESGWNSVTVDRGITKPTFDQITDFDVNTCKININAAKNLNLLTDISYSSRLVRSYIIGSDDPAQIIFPYVVGRPASAPASVPAQGVPFFLDYAIPNGWNILDFNLENKDQVPGAQPGLVIPGVRHKIKVTAYDRKYFYALSPLSPVTGPGATTEEVTSDEFECGYRPPVILPGSNTSGPVTDCFAGGATASCTIFFQSFPSSVLGKIEIYVIKNKTLFAENYDSLVLLPLCGFNSSSGPSTQPEGCRYVIEPYDTIPPFKPSQYPKNTCSSPTVNSYAGTYGIAYRFLNGTKKGAWSAPVICTVQ